MKLLEHRIPMSFTVAEAIVLANFIERMGNFSETSCNVSSSEKRALWNLQCLLERELVEPLITDYQSTLIEADRLLGGEGETI